MQCTGQADALCRYCLAHSGSCNTAFLLLVQVRTEVLVLKEYICFTARDYYSPFIYLSAIFKINFGTTYILFRDIGTSIKKKFPLPNQKMCGNSQGPHMQLAVCLKIFLWKWASVFGHLKKVWFGERRKTDLICFALKWKSHPMLL